MLSTIYKELSANDAKRVSEAEKILTNLAKLQDRAWLSKDLAFYEANYPKNFLTRSREPKQICRSLGEVSYADNRGFKDLFFPNTEESCRINTRTALFLEMTTGDPRQPLAFFLKLLGAPTSFSLGPLYSQKIEEVAQRPTSLIFEITRYFFTRPYQYQAIYACLVKNKSEFAEIFGAAFIEDFSRLFSVPIFKKEIQNFDFALKEPGTPLFCQLLTKNDITWNFPFLEGTGGGYYKTFTWWTPELDAYVYLSRGNILTLDSRIFERNENFLRSGNGKKFITLRINNTLKQMVSIAEFGKAIYSQVNNKIFLENF